MSQLRLLTVAGLVALFLMLGSALTTRAFAPAICGTHDNPASCEPLFDKNEQLAIRAGIPFVWLRKTPSSSADIVRVINYSAKPVLTVVQWPSQFDGYQNWWLVAPLTNPSQTGWVEQSSLVDATAPVSVPQANWTAPFTARIRNGVPFVWIRDAAYSSASIVSTILPKDTFTVLSSPAPVSDGRQWWWYVRTASSRDVKEGYVEQASIAPIGNLPPTPVPTSVPAGGTPRPTCGTLTVSPATYKAPEAPNAAAIYYVTPGSNLTFRVDKLANLASITFQVPLGDATIWRNNADTRTLEYPGTQAEVYLTVPQAYGWSIVSAWALGLNGETIQCGGFWIDNGTGSATPSPSS